MNEGDTRWIHRSAYDLMDYRPDATESISKMPRGKALYGPLPQQLADESSFACRLRDILAIRKRYGIATAIQIDVPQVSNKAMLVMVHQLSDAEQVTVLNFSASPISGSVISESLVPGSVIVDMMTDQEIGEVDDLHSFAITLAPHEGRSLLVLCPGDHPSIPIARMTPAQFFATEPCQESLQCGRRRPDGKARWLRAQASLNSARPVVVIIGEEPV